MLGGTWTKLFFGFNRWNFGVPMSNPQPPGPSSFEKHTAKYPFHPVSYLRCLGLCICRWQLGLKLRSWSPQCCFQNFGSRRARTCISCRKDSPWHVTERDILGLHCEIWRMVPSIHSTYTSHTLLLWPLLLPWCCKHGAAWQMLQRRIQFVPIPVEWLHPKLFRHWANWNSENPSKNIIKQGFSHGFPMEQQPTFG